MARILYLLFNIKKRNDFLAFIIYKHIKMYNKIFRLNGKENLEVVNNIKK